jgi:hypothetical protein
MRWLASIIFFLLLFMYTLGLPPSLSSVLLIVSVGGMIPGRVKRLERDEIRDWLCHG